MKSKTNSKNYIRQSKGIHYTQHFKTSLTFRKRKRKKGNSIGRGNKFSFHQKRNISKVSDVSFKVRSGYCCLDFSGENVPYCPHGPCILLGKKSASGEITDRTFVCAVYRGGECRFNCPVTENGFFEVQGSSITPDDNPCSSKVVYRKVWKSVNHLSRLKEKLFYCKTCNDAVSSMHNHLVVGPLKRSDFRKPSILFSSDDTDSGKAVNDFDSVLCIGTPTVFEFMRSTPDKRTNVKSFLLDVDARFAAFYGSAQFAQYSMLVDYFYNGSNSAKLDQFFASARKLVVVCDPPFGVLLDPLLKSLDKIRLRFCQTDTTRAEHFNLILTLPYFLEKFLRYSSRPLKMADYMVCYANHRKYSRASGTVVRFFTDIPLSSFPLPLESGYRFCEICDRYVSSLNNHCGLCSTCPSKNGLTYRHCENCFRCVKPTYRHCKTCSRCHLPGRCASQKTSNSD